ncbi:unnamed protein product [Ceutorhynchus assimilis]|uniref:adenylate kinase n=1 Tax=Ceutorhynchus assimilis TaxID=467358 RepID=A0A9P0DN94_9CUCU|nr:unnamed protein product [Ceutorhynchus assimilis]
MLNYIDVRNKKYVKWQSVHFLTVMHVTHLDTSNVKIDVSRNTSAFKDGNANAKTYISPSTGNAKSGAPIPDINVPIIWILGGPGSGKGTQCDRIVAKYGFTHLSSGDLLRNEVSSGSSRGKELTAIMERGELVPMQVVLDLLKEAILKAVPSSKGFLIDGYPREKEQGIAFESNIAPVDLVLFYDASEKTLIDRLLDRAKTSGRVDDNEETIKKRLQTFNTHNDHVVQQYLKKLKKIDAERSTDDVFAETATYIDQLLVKYAVKHDFKSPCPPSVFKMLLTILLLQLSIQQINPRHCNSIETPLIYHKIKSCHKSTSQIIFWKRVSTLQDCKDATRSKNGLAFNFSPLEAENFTKFEPNCQVLACPQIDETSLVMHLGYDYYSAYGNLNATQNVTCIKSLGLFALTPKNLNYSQSILACQNSSADLADITTEYRTVMLSEMLKNHISDWYKAAYVGLDDLRQESTFENSMGKRLTCSNFRSWAPGHPRSKHPQENCVVMDSEKLWRVVNCARTELRALCELFPTAPKFKENVPKNVSCDGISEMHKIKKKKCLWQLELFQIYQNSSRLDRCALLDYNNEI